MRCSKCGEEVHNFPEHLAGLAEVVCKKCIGKLERPVDLQSLAERLNGKTSVPTVENDEPIAA